MYISESQIRPVLTYSALIPAIRQALIDYSAGRVEQPQRMVLRGGNAEGHLNGWFGVMPAIYGDFMSVKIVTAYPGNAALGLSTHTAIVELLDRATGQPLAVMDGTLITEMRTAAVSANALAALLPPGARSLGIFGSGTQARAHIEAFRHVWPTLNEVRIWSRTAAHAARLAKETNSNGQARARSVSAEEAGACDVVLTVTSSPAPVLEGRWLSPHALVLAVGATGSSLRELDDAAMQSAWVVAESKSSVEREAGDVIDSGAKVQAEIGHILANPTYIVPRDRPIVFKSVGMAVEDLTAARLVWQALGSSRPAEPA